MKKRKWQCALLLIAAVFGCAGGSLAAVSQVPVFATSNPVAPNLMFTLDDSGSMGMECVPDPLCEGSTRLGSVPGVFNSGKAGVAEYGSLRGAQMRSPATNPIYYNPEVRYQPWLKADGTRFPLYSPTVAPDDPQAPTANQFNLAAVTTLSTNWCTSPSSCSTSDKDVQIAQYFKLNPGTTGNSLSDFTLVLIENAGVYPKGSARTDCAGTSCSYAEELQNFANWFTYARSRIKVAIGGTSEAFGSVPDYFRVGYGTINSLATLVDGVTTDTILLGVRPFSGAGKNAFYSRLQSTTTSSNTPLRRAVGDVGQYYSRTDANGPWSDNPATGRTKPDLSCRRSFNLLMTDGIWNSTPAALAAAQLDVDSTSGPLITGPNGKSYQYTPAPPYIGPGPGTLADVAMYYWNHDLRPDLENDVSESTDNPAFWQHMVTYTIAFGVSGNLKNPEDWAELSAGTKGWGTPISNGQAANIDDLWHAAANSRGKSLSAASTTEYGDAVSTLLSDIVRRSGSEAGVAVSGRAYSATARKYVPSYSTDGWYGELSAVGIGSGATVWRASQVLPAPALRNIYTFADTATRGVRFNLSDLTSAGMTPLLASGTPGGLINFLRGDRANEGATYRARSSLLGDIVNSTPIYVGDLADGQYDFLPLGTPGQSVYRKFLLSKKERAPQIFVGANDGMLHAFSDADGVETFAFVPRSVLGNLNKLAQPGYSHQYFVDGQFVEADVYDAANTQWRNLVVGGSGAGAKNLFAVNVPVKPWAGTGPAPMTLAESTPGSSDVLWEVNTGTRGFSELGYGLRKSEVGLLRDGTWAVVVGNGYDSASGKAQLFLVNALTGALIKVIDTGMGSAATPNGLGGARVVLDKQQRIVGVYAGDMRGNMWKFDLSSTATTDWSVAFGGQPLFKAVNAAGQVEPITATPNYLNHPLGGTLVLSGSGKLFEAADPLSTEQRTLYGVWDKVSIGSASTNAGLAVSDVATSLVAQSVSATPIVGAVGGVFYSVSSNSVDYGSGGKRGWRLPLTQQPGQRLINDPWLAVGRVFFDTIAPGDASASCAKPDAKAYTFVLDPFTGGPGSDGPTFDTNGNLLLGAGDDISAAVIQTDVGGPRVGVQYGMPSRLGIVGPSGAPVVVQGAKNIVLRSWRHIVSPPAP